MEWENLSTDSAIRQFCAARVEGEQGQWGSIIDLEQKQDLELWDFTVEVDELVDTFFNVEYCEEEEEENYFAVMDDEPMRIQESNGVDQGLQLVHLLLACAEAVGCRDAHLADSILAQIWPRVNSWGDSLQRVSLCFAMGLKSRLPLVQSVNPNGTFSCRANNVLLISLGERSEAFALLYQKTPYVSFGFMAANDAICQAASGKDLIHIVDLGMEHSLQWPSMVKKLSCRQEGPPTRVRITGIVGDRDTTELENSMWALCGQAFEVGITLELNLVREEVSPSTLSCEKLGLRVGEMLLVNCMMQLHKHVKESRGSLNPSLVTVVEQDANHNVPFFVGRFLESLHYYYAIFDSLDASLSRESLERMKIEKFHLAEEIQNVVACEGCDRVERHERADQWRRQLGRADFQAVGLKCLEEVKSLVSGYGCEGYTVAAQKWCIQLGWKGRPYNAGICMAPKHFLTKNNHLDFSSHFNSIFTISNFTINFNYSSIQKPKPLCNLFPPHWIKLF